MQETGLHIAISKDKNNYAQIRILIFRFFVSQYPLLSVDSRLVVSVHCRNKLSKNKKTKSLTFLVLKIFKFFLKKVAVLS